MVRTSQSAAAGPPPAWTTTSFTDHAGRDAFRFERSSRSGPPAPAQEQEQEQEQGQEQPLGFPFQIYSLIPLDDGQRRILIEFLESDILSEPVVSSWDIYSGSVRDIFACVHHQRREIAHRKARTGNGSTQQQQQQAGRRRGHGTEGRSNLIPKVAFSEHDRRRYGLLVVVVTTVSFHTTAGARPADFDPSGPLCLVHFDRRFPQRSTTDAHLRLEDDPLLARSVGMAPEDIAVLPEKPEIVATRVQELGALPAKLTALYRKSLCDDGTLDYALGEDEGSPAEDPSVATDDDVRAMADVVAGQLSADDATQDTQPVDVNPVPGEGVVLLASSSSPSGPPDLSYLVYAPFVPAISQNSRGDPGGNDDAQQEMALLTSVARTFTSALLTQVPAAKTISLQFHARQPVAAAGNGDDGTSGLGSIAEHCRHAQSRAADPVGALVTTLREDGTQQQQRLFPCTNSEGRERQPPVERYRTFAVVLDRPDFIRAPGVLFVMADGGKYKALLDENGSEYEHPIIGPHCDYNEFLVSRSHGMAEAARRLAMLVFEDEPQGDSLSCVRS